MTAGKLSRRSLLSASASAGLAAVGAASLSAPALAQNRVEWRMQALWDGNTTPQKYEERFVQRVSELTDGRFKINLFSAGQILPPAQAFDGVRGGAFEMMKTFDGYEAGKIPAFAFTSTVPLGFDQPDHYEAWFYELGGIEMAREAYGPAGLHYIAPTIYGNEPIHSKAPIRSLADLKGKKGRFVGLASTVMAAFGVSVTPLATAEVYNSLEMNIIDMADRGDLTANFEAGLSEVANFILWPSIHQPTTATSYVANKAAYDKLPQDFKAALAVAAREVSGALRQRLMVADADAIGKFKSKGVEISSLSPDEVRETRSKAVEIWKIATKGDALASKMLESQIAFMKQLGLLA